MLKVENIEVYNIARAVYSARNAMNSWDKSDSDLKNDILGEADLELARKLYKAGSEHRKYLRQIFVSMDITAPEYFFSQFDTYKVGTTSNSTSKMHTLHKRNLTIDDFSHDNMSAEGENQLKDFIEIINRARRAYVQYNNPTFWNDMIKLLPMSFNQRRTITMNYENVVNIIHQRTGHKLTEWHELIEVLRELPYIKEITNLND